MDNNNVKHDMLNLAISVAKELKIMPQNGILLMNIQRNYTGEFTSVVVDVDMQVLMPKYPKEIEGKPTEMKLDNKKYIVSYFHRPQIRAENMEAAVKSGDNQPFCCNSVRPYKNISTKMEAIFNQFMEKRGTVNDRLFEVKRQVNFGPLLSTKYFVLQDGIQREIPNPEQKFKDHSFKNYKCGNHNLFFELNLYSFRKVSNCHHQRPNPGTSDDMTVLFEVAKFLGLIA